MVLVCVLVAAGGVAAGGGKESKRESAFLRLCNTRPYSFPYI